jgi:OFA family oxalate/formate antiporter-like MFS transporter
MEQQTKAPARAWVVTFAGMAVNLCLGILYAWSVWKADLVAKEDHPAGSAMAGLNEGWSYLTDAQATWAYAICGFVFALFMIPGGRIQDKYGPKLGATLGGLFLATGCIVAGLMKSYVGLVTGFGVLGGIGMGLGYSAATPAAVRWFGPHRRGLIVGIVVGGYGGAAIYIAPLAKYLIAEFGLSGSFIGLGILFAVVVIVAGQLLTMPPAGYVPPTSANGNRKMTMTVGDWSPGAMTKTWQFYGLVFLFICTAQSGLLVIANATPVLNETAGALTLFASHSWLLAAYGGLMNAAGRVGTGLYSDKIGRANAYLLNGLLSVTCLLLMPWIIESRNVAILFLVVGVVYWQYGGGLALMPAFTADYFGSKNLGFNYGLVFLGSGIALFVPQLDGYIKEATGNLYLSFYLSAGLLGVAVAMSRLMRRPLDR